MEEYYKILKNKYRLVYVTPEFIIKEEEFLKELYEKDVLISLYNGEKWLVSTENIKNLNIEMRKKEGRIDRFMTKLNSNNKILSQVEGEKEEELLSKIKNDYYYYYNIENE